MLEGRRWLFILCIVVVAAACVAFVIAKNGSGSQVSIASLGESFEKTGKIRHMTFIYPIPGDCCSLPLTFIEFEDGDYYQFYGILNHIKEGKTYRIVYQEQERICCNDDECFNAIKTSTLNVVQVMEEIVP